MDALAAQAFKEQLRRRCLAALAQRRRRRKLRGLLLAALVLLAVGLGLWARGGALPQPPGIAGPLPSSSPAWQVATRPLQEQHRVHEPREVVHAEERPVSWLVESRSIALAGARPAPALASDGELLSLFPEQPRALIGSAADQRLELLARAP